MSITQGLARYCDEMKFRQLPAEVVDRAKYLFLDFIGAVCCGSGADSSKRMYHLVREMGQGKGVLIGTKERAPFLYSALANGTAGHAMEMDDVNNASSLHPGVVIFPSALATSEMIEATGKRMIEAVVLGYEVMIRLGKALGPKNSYERGFHPTGICGTFGSSVTASKLMSLNEERIASAMGIAGSQASGSMEFLAQGAWTKRFHAGWAAYSGMIASLLARKGFRGPTSIIEGRDGFLHAYSSRADASKILEGIGSGFEILRTSVKPYACCRYMQPPIDALLKIVKENDLKPDQIEKVSLGLLSPGTSLIAEPAEIKYRPQSIVDAQFSMPFGAAVSLLYRKAGLREFQISRIQSEEVKQMMKRVKCQVDPELDRTFPDQWCGTAEILTKDGIRFFTKIEYCKGDPENPLSWDELIEKFHDLSRNRMTKKKRLKIVDQVRHLEEVRNVRQWSPVLLGDR